MELAWQKVGKCRVAFVEGLVALLISTDKDDWQVTGLPQILESSVQCLLFLLGNRRVNDDDVELVGARDIKGLVDIARNQIAVPTISEAADYPQPLIRIAVIYQDAGGEIFHS